MIVTSVTRSYSRSLNTKSYGSQVESWVKVEATYTGECESGDDPIKVSEMLHEQAQKDVAASVTSIIEKIKAANPNTIPATMTPTTSVTSTAPAAQPRAL